MAWSNQSLVVYHGTDDVAAHSIISTGASPSSGRAFPDFGPGLREEVTRLTIKSNVMGDLAVPARREIADDRAEIPSDLLHLAREYRDVRLADYQSRVFRKDQLADQMAALILAQAISRDLLARSEEDGLHAALMTVVIVQPERSDLPRVLRVVAQTKLKHIYYRAVLALAELLKREYVGMEDEGKVVDLLYKLRNVDVPPLQRLITRPILCCPPALPRRI